MDSYWHRWFLIELCIHPEGSGIGGVLSAAVFHQQLFDIWLCLILQVIDGGQGDIDINFHLYSPTGRQIVSDYKKSDNAHR